MCRGEPVAEPVTCETYEYPGSRSIFTGASDLVGNTKRLKPTGALRMLRPKTGTTSNWVQNTRGSWPMRDGASTTVTVKGRQVALATSCGKGAGTIRVEVPGQQLKTINLSRGFTKKSAADGATCVPVVFDIKGKTKITVTYVKLSAKGPRADVVLGFPVLR